MQNVHSPNDNRPQTGKSISTNRWAKCGHQIRTELGTKKEEQHIVT
jgi:hypothetical protein